MVARAYRTQVQKTIRRRAGRQGYIGRYCSGRQSKLTIEEMAQQVPPLVEYQMRLKKRASMFFEASINATDPQAKAEAIREYKMLNRLIEDLWCSEKVLRSGKRLKRCREI
jgi:hypothetical protein